MVRFTRSKRMRQVGIYVGEIDVHYHIRERVFACGRGSRLFFRVDLRHRDLMLFRRGGLWKTLRIL